MMDVKDARKIIKDLSEKTFICSEYCIETESGYVITTKEKQKYARSKKQTNADRIRNFSDEELAEFLEKTVYYCRGRQNDKYCEDCPLFECRVCNGEYIGKWLQAEVKEGGADECS